VIYNLPGGGEEKFLLSHSYSPGSQVNGFYQTGLSPSLPATNLLFERNPAIDRSPVTVTYGYRPSFVDFGGISPMSGKSLFDQATIALGPATGAVQAGATALTTIQGTAPNRYGPELVAAGVSGLNLSKGGGGRSVRVGGARRSMETRSSRLLADYGDYETDLSGLAAGGASTSSGRGGRSRGARSSRKNMFVSRFTPDRVRLGSRRTGRRSYYSSLKGLSGRGGGVSSSGRGLDRTSWTNGSDRRGMTSMQATGDVYTGLSGLSDIFGGLLNGVKSIWNPLKDTLTDPNVSQSLKEIGGKPGNILSAVGISFSDLQKIPPDELKKIGSRAALEELAYKLRPSRPIATIPAAGSTVISLERDKAMSPSFWQGSSFGVSNKVLTATAGGLLLFLLSKKGVL